MTALEYLEKLVLNKISDVEIVQSLFCNGIEIGQLKISSVKFKNTYISISRLKNTEPIKLRVAYKHLKIEQDIPVNSELHSKLIENFLIIDRYVRNKDENEFNEYLNS